MWYNINRTGRLGNRLFSRAHVYAAALELNETVIDWGLIDSKEFFPKVGATNIPIYPLKRNGNHPILPNNLLTKNKTLSLINFLRPRNTGQMGIFWNQSWGKGNSEDVRLDSLRFKDFNSKNKIIFLNGFKLICPDLVKKHRIEICKYFQLPLSYLDKWKFLINSFRENYSSIIGLHIRHGDFKTAMRGEYYLTSKEYAQIIHNRLQIEFRNSLFIIFSDERFIKQSDWEDLKSSFNFTNIILSNGTILDDLCGLMHCDKIIGPMTSTFSRWPAFAGNKEWAGLRRSSLYDNKAIKFITCPIPWGYKI